MAEFVTEEPQAQRRDTLGLAAGIIFATVGLAYLFGGHRTISDNWGLVLPAMLVLLGVAGLASSGVIRRPQRAAAAVEPESLQPVEDESEI